MSEIELDAEKLTNVAVGVAKSALLKNGTIHPHVLVAKGNQVAYLDLPSSKELWMPFVEVAVKRLDADFYVFVTEAWGVAPENYDQNKRVSENPAKFEIVMVVCQFRNGTTKSISQQFVHDYDGIKFVDSPLSAEGKTSILPTRW